MGSVCNTMCKMLSDDRHIEIRVLGASSFNATKPKSAARKSPVGVT